MKKIITTIFVVALVIQAQAQQVPTISNPPNGGQTNPGFWSRAGNLGNGGNNQNNLFGTKWNSPIYTITGNNFNAQSYRMKVNGIFYNSGQQYPINGFGWNQGVNTTGYVLIGNNGNSITDNKPLYNQKGAFSLLHLNGIGSAYQEYGYRPWMKTGITFTGNQDLSYIGLRKLSTNPSQEDITETAFLWSDNSQSSYGPDKLVFRFSGYGGSDGNSVSSNRLSTTDLDALHVAQFTGTGLMGLGNTFGTNATGMAAANYVDPKSLLHMSYDWRAGAANLAYGFAQITYRRDGTNMIGTGETENDGLRFGIDNTAFSTGGSQYLNGYLRWQEASSFIIQTDWDNTPGGVQNGERLRITSIGALNSTQGNFGGLTAPINRTRVAISADGATPITQPRSLLHLGYNTSSVPILGSPLNDGWRNWMDVGTFTSVNSDNMYVGMKKEGTDRYDAVINWGDNQVAGANPNGPDHLRFIFTSTTSALTGQGNAVAQSTNGLETMRIVPFRDTTYYIVDTSGVILDSVTTYGRVGIGDFTSQGVNEEPTHKLDVVGNGRFRYLPDSIYKADTTVTKYVMVDQAGVLRWSDAPPSGLGALCGDTVNGNLKDNTHIDLNNFNYYYTNNDSLSVNHVGIGYDCGDSLPAKLSVIQAHPTPVNTTSTIAVLGTNTDTSATNYGTFVGVVGLSTGVQPNGSKVSNIGGYFSAQDAPISIGVMANMPAYTNNQYISIAGKFDVRTATSYQNLGVTSSVTGSSNQNIAGNFTAISSNPSAMCMGVNSYAFGTNASNIAGSFRAGNQLISPYYPSNAVIAVYGNSAPFTNTNATANGFAGFFDGNVFINGPANGPAGYAITSDIQFKNDTAAIAPKTADSLLALLKPKSFYFDTTNNFGMNFSSQKQYGLIAQEVETVLPNLVGKAYKPAMVDSIGTVITQAVSYKTLTYSEFIPLLIAGFQAQKSKIDSLISNTSDTLYNDSLLAKIDSLIQENQVTQNKADSLENVVGDLNNRLTQLENCLGNLLPLLCQLNQSMIQTNNEDAQQQLRSLIRVDLNDNENIVLDQNVPNPFAESTIIRYSIPTSVQKAQIHFYNLSGRLMKVVDITERGAGQLNVFGQDLSSGVYTYTLVADGRIIDTKKMVKEGY